MEDVQPAPPLAHRDTVGRSRPASAAAGGGPASAAGGNSQGRPLALAQADRSGAAGNGGAVSVVNGGRIDTFGFGAHGIFAQSVGGGGGSGAGGTAGAPGQIRR